MTREEAIKIIKTATVYTPKEMEALETLIPELRESEDERIVNWLIRLINTGRYRELESDPMPCSRGKLVAYLEKQKEQKPFWNPTEEDVTLFNRAVTTNTTLTPQERAKLDIIRMKFKHCPYIEQQQEQPVMWSKDDYHWEGLKELLRDYQKTIDRQHNNMAYESVELYIDWIDSLFEQPASDFCKENCKGYRESGRCFLGGPCVGKQETSKEQPDGLGEDIETEINETADEDLGKALGCRMEFPYFGAQYPDARCIDGYLWDLDSYEEGLGLTSGGDDPCPFCNTAAWLDEVVGTQFDSRDEAIAWLQKTQQKYDHTKR